jgi:hypothetical protein
MSTEDNQSGERAVREKIVRLMKSIGQASTGSIPDEEMRKLKNAASRLDQILNSRVHRDEAVLRNALGRLDQLLADIRTGKDVTADLTRKPASLDQDE